MIKLTPTQIKEIAMELETGMKCFYNKHTGKITTLPDVDEFDLEEELWGDPIEEIEDNEGDYIVFEGMPSRYSFTVMADFVETIDDTKLRNRLTHVLNKPRPFANFKWEIDNSGEYRQEWFDYRSKRYIEWVKEQLDSINEE